MGKFQKSPFFGRPFSHLSHTVRHIIKITPSVVLFIIRYHSLSFYVLERKTPVEV
jgi:hypothetical protein